MKRKIQIYIVISSILICTICIYVYRWEFRESRLEVSFFSLNRGRSIFIRTPDNKTILYGGGQNSATISEITKVMPVYSRRIDYVVIPSATPAQIGGLIEILERYEVGEVIRSKYMATSTVLTQLMKVVEKKKIHIRYIEKGDTFDIASTTLKVLFPDPKFKFNKTSLPELGIYITYGNTDIFLLGNLSKTIQNSIAKSMEDDGKDTILELYSSGISSKLSQNLVDVIKPKYIFTTKEKSIRFVSDGFFWSR